MFSIVSQFLFGNSSIFSSTGKASSFRNASWKDKSLCFDLRLQDLEIDGGEQLIGSFFPIEDVKGNPDEFGLLEITNLRLIWICCKKKRINLSIGWRTVLLAYENNLKDAMGASTTSLFILTKYESTKYEFVFNRPSAHNDIWMSNQENWQALAQLSKFHRDKPTLVSHLSPMYLADPFEIVFKVWQAYKQTHLFRHCRCNSANLLPNRDTNKGLDLDLNEINKLPSEEIIEVLPGVCQQESRFISYSGNLILTNIRLIWFDYETPMRNFSIPYARIDSLKDKLIGRKVTVSTYDYLISSTHVNFVLKETDETVFKQMKDLHSSFKANPRFGPESCPEILNFIGNLKPIECYLNSIDGSMGRVLENLGPQRNISQQQEDGVLVSDGATNRQQYDKPNSNDFDEDEVERTECELNKYGTNLRRYLNEQPLERDSELTYSAELGLAIEKPTNGMDIRRLWQIDL